MGARKELVLSVTFDLVLTHAAIREALKEYNTENELKGEDRIPFDDVLAECSDEAFESYVKQLGDEPFDDEGKGFVRWVLEETLA